MPPARSGPTPTPRSDYNRGAAVIDTIVLYWYTPGTKYILDIYGMYVGVENHLWYHTRSDFQPREHADDILVACQSLCFL